MKTLKIAAALALTVLSGSAPALDMATPEEAKALAKQAQAAVNNMGAERAFAAFAAQQGGFRSKDLYVFCMGLDGRVLAHTAEPRLVGRNLRELSLYGAVLFHDMLVAVQDSGEGWASYKWTYPGTTEIRRKTTYLAINDEGFFCGAGYYAGGSDNRFTSK